MAPNVGEGGGSVAMVAAATATSATAESSGAAAGDEPYQQARPAQDVSSHANRGSDDRTIKVFREAKPSVDDGSATSDGEEAIGFYNESKPPQPNADTGAGYYDGSPVGGGTQSSGTSSTNNGTSALPSATGSMKILQSGSQAPVPQQARLRNANPIAGSGAKPARKDGAYYSRTVKKGVQDFDFGRVLGEGSYSTVVFATDRQNLREFAVKILDKRHIIKEKKVKYVNIEKDTFNRLTDHPGILRLYCTFQDERRLYFVLDLASNGELLAYLQKMSTFDEASTQYYGAQILEAIEYMHSRGVIHRDLKPENVLLDAKFRIKIADFGTAKLLDLPGTTPASSNGGTKQDTPTTDRANSFVGTAEYVSPELLTDKSACKASDIWAFGCIIYQLLAGRPPFKASNEYQTFQKIIHLDYSFPLGFPSTAVDLVQRILVLDPARRPTIAQIKQHPFFKGVAWGTPLWTMPAPRIGPRKPETAAAASAASLAFNRQAPSQAQPNTVVLANGDHRSDGSKAAHETRRVSTERKRQPATAIRTKAVTGRASEDGGAGPGGKRDGSGQARASPNLSPVIPDPASTWTQRNSAPSSPRASLSPRASASAAPPLSPKTSSTVRRSPSSPQLSVSAAGSKEGKTEASKSPVTDVGDYPQALTNDELLWGSVLGPRERVVKIGQVNVWTMNSALPPEDPSSGSNSTMATSSRNPLLGKLFSRRKQRTLMVTSLGRVVFVKRDKEGRAEIMEELPIGIKSSTRIVGPKRATDRNWLVGYDNRTLEFEDPGNHAEQWVIVLKRAMRERGAAGGAAASGNSVTAGSSSHSSSNTTQHKRKSFLFR